MPISKLKLEKITPLQLANFVYELALIPNVFTPNGDGKNDYFEIPGLDDPCAGISRLMIFNRWGMKVYESSGSQLKWDGTYNGGNLTPGVYFYVLEGEDSKNRGV